MALALRKLARLPDHRMLKPVLVLVAELVPE
jgi:hypothetical protein